MKIEPKIAPSLPPAPEGQQGPPTRAATSDSWRSLRDARGSLPLTSGTASSGDKKEKKKEDARCWYEGYWVGRRGQPRRSPYTIGSLESWSWTGGWIEGNDRRQKDTRQA